MRQIGAGECLVIFDPSLIQEALAHCPSCPTDTQVQTKVQTPTITPTGCGDITRTMINRYNHL